MTQKVSMPLLLLLALHAVLPMFVAADGTLAGSSSSSGWLVCGAGGFITFEIVDLDMKCPEDRFLLTEEHGTVLFDSWLHCLDSIDAPVFEKFTSMSELVHYTVMLAPTADSDGRNQEGGGEGHHGSYHIDWRCNLNTESNEAPDLRKVRQRAHWQAWTKSQTTQADEELQLEQQKNASGGCGKSCVLGIVLPISIITCCCCCCYCCRKREGEERQQVYTSIQPSYSTVNATKIQAAVATMVVFLRKLMGQRDRCSVVAFNTSYMSLVNLGPESRALGALQALLPRCDGGTKLWDSVAASVLQFIETADRSRPWVLVVLTDGDDTGSQLSLSETSQALQLFNSVNSNFTFVIGLGREVNQKDLRQLCDSSGSFYLPAENSSVLHALFAMIALQVVEGVRVDLSAIQTNGVEAVFARVERARQLQRQPIDILLLVDISGSMNGY